VKSRAVWLLPLLAVALAVPLLAPAAFSAPIDDLAAQAEQLEKDLNAANVQVATVGDQLAAAQDRLDGLLAKIADANRRIELAEARTAELRALIADRAAAVYRNAGTDGPLEMIDVDDAGDAGSREKYTDVASARDDALVDELDAAKRDLQDERDEAEQLRKAAQEERDNLAAAKTEADAAAAHLQGLLDRVEGQMAEALRQLTIQRAAATAAAPRTGGGSGGSSGGGGSGGGGSSGGGSSGGGPPPLGHGGAGAAVAYAQAQVGKPYCNTNPARFGPDCYDCSGLTSSAWRAGGLTIPTVSGAQGAAYPRVPLSQLQPGDLITITSWGAHVGIWVGGGYVHATKPGDVVKYVPGGSVVDAVRPG
jgi:cell wall-associated NlpC family hydrolase